MIVSGSIPKALGPGGASSKSGSKFFTSGVRSKPSKTGFKVKAPQAHKSCMEKQAHCGNY